MQNPDADVRTFQTLMTLSCLIPSDNGTYANLGFRVVTDYSYQP